MEDKTKILIVDDEQINLDFFDVMLSKLGFIVEMAEDGEEALEKVQDCNPDLIILDNIMPKLSGWKVTRILKTDPAYAEFQDIPIIMFSAMDDVKDKIEGYELGIEDYIIKPFNFSEVLARIRAVLRSRELAKQVLQKEKRISLVESLNKSLIYFTEHLKNPVLELLKRSENLDCTDSETVSAYVKTVIKESEAVIAVLKGLEEEIKELQSAGVQVNTGEVLLQELEEKFQKHFVSWKE